MSDASHLGLSRIIPEGAVQHRDAIHIAVVPVRVDKTCRPGQRVGIAESLSVSGELTVTALYEESIGVIDPFLQRPVMHGQRCWLYLDPGSINSLRHEWTHPVLDKEPS